MNISTKDTANKLALRIFNSQDINHAFREIYEFLAANFPLDFYDIPVFEEKAANRIAHYRVVVTKGQVIMVNETVKLSEEAYQELDMIRDEKVVLLNSSEQSAVLQEVAAHLGIPGKFSTLSASTRMAANRYAIFGLVAMGKDRYLESHFQRLEEMYEVISSITMHMVYRLDAADLNDSLTMENKELQKRLGYYGSSRIIGMDSGLSEISEQIEQVSPLDSPVLIMGETGVGKEVVANAIHQKSHRSDNPFVSLNCGAIPETLLESTLFGHEKGAFTGADHLRKGYFEQADGGTIFLDEIGELSLAAQVKLLRLIQTMEFMRVGGQHNISVNVRIIAATNRDLHAMVRSHLFRKDLWFRLNVFPLLIPPLRKREEDIPVLAEYFMRQKSQEINIAYTPSFAPEALTQLRSYEWPGNVRELQNVIERALIISKGQPISFDHLDEADTPVEPSAPSAPGQTRFLTMAEMIIQHIVTSLELSNGKIDGAGGAAELLDMHPSTLRGRMRKFGIRTNRTLSIST